MRPEPSLKKVSDSLTLWHRLFGQSLASMWSRSHQPPVSARHGGFYAAALAAKLEGEAETQVARCLLWCDAEARQYAPARLPWYRVAADAFPEDERCAFFLAALCRQRVVDDAQVAERVYASLFRPSWSVSRFWEAFDLKQRVIATELALIYAQSDEVTPERAASVENALRWMGERQGQRGVLAAYLARAYRAQDRRDEPAVAIYIQVFAAQPDEEENTLFLAQLYARQERCDANACQVYAHLAQRQPPEGAPWAVRLACALAAADRVDERVLATLRRLGEHVPGEPQIAAALAFAAAQQADPDATTLADLQRAWEHEADLLPVFEEQGWAWIDVMRALGLAWGKALRTDTEARTVYQRVLQLSPGDKRLWLLYAQALALAEDYGEAALPVYEKAVGSGSGIKEAGVGGPDLLAALGRTYIEMEVGQGEHRARVIDVWESLYRQGQGGPELVQALAQAYTLDERVSDVALAIWSQLVEDEPKNGKLRVRLGRECKARGDLEEALRWYQAGAKLCPRSFEAQMESGLLLLERSGDGAGAEKTLRKAVKLQPKHVGAHFALGEALLSQDKRDEAKAVFEQIVNTLDANHTPSIMHLAKLNLKYDEQGAKAAEALYEQAKHLDPERPETYRQLAELYREKGQHDEEQEALESYLKLSSPSPELYRQLADLYIRRNDFARAEGALRQVIALGAGDKKTFTLLGEVMVQARSEAA